MKKKEFYKHAVQQSFIRLVFSICSFTVFSYQLNAEALADNLEPAKQGQSISQDRPGNVLPIPYSMGVNVIGHSPVLERDSNLQMAWSGHCAYISSTSPNFLGWGITARPETFGVAVIDVSDPLHPKDVKVLRDKGSLYSAESMDTANAADRKVLAAGTYQGGAEPERDARWLSIYDLSDCANPKLTAEFQWPEQVHATAVSPNGRRIYATQIDPFNATGAIHVLDINDMANPLYLGKFEVVGGDGAPYGFAVHDITFSADETRIYAGVLGSQGNDLNHGIKPFPPSTKYLGPDGGGIYILDNSDLASGKTDAKLTLLGTAQHGGWHSPVPATINGKPYLVSGGELGACPGAWPRITDISTESNPELAGEFKLAMNKMENCPPQSETEKASGGIVGDPGTATLHYNDVDSAIDTRLGLFNFMWAGMRIADLRNPTNPKEIAYFKPGDACTGQARYVKETGHIWFTCAKSGFHVLELKSELRKLIDSGNPEN